MDPSVPSMWRREPRPPEAVPVNVGGCYWRPASSSPQATVAASATATAAATAVASATSNFF